MEPPRFTSRAAVNHGPDNEGSGTSGSRRYFAGTLPHLSRKEPLLYALALPIASLPPMATANQPSFDVMHLLRRLAIGVLFLALAAFIAFVVWVRQIAPADAGASLAFDSDGLVAVTRGDWITFQPRDADPITGVIFYPGGKAEPAAYAPMLRSLAERGFLVVMTPMPMNLALLAPERASRVPPRFTGVRRWIIAGHSLGGAIACEFAKRHPEQVAGLLLWASYPGPDTDLSLSGLPVLSVSGSADDLTTPDKIAEARGRLPPDTRYLAVQGANHWSFGDFALSEGSAERGKHQAEILEATQTFLDAISQGTDLAS